MKTCADYIFVFSKIDPKTGIYETIGVSADEDQVAYFLQNIEELKRIEVFHEGLLEGPTRILTTIEEFEELQ